MVHISCKESSQCAVDGNIINQPLATIYVLSRSDQEMKTYEMREDDKRYIRRGKTEAERKEWKRKAKREKETKTDTSGGKKR